MVKTVIKYTFILYTFGIIDVNIYTTQNPKSLTLTKSNMRNNMKRRDTNDNLHSTFYYHF
jgi:hypothetical protein